jgi:hypothetical protein
MNENDTITSDYRQAEAQAAPTAAPGLFSRAVCVLLETSCLGTSRKVATGAVDTKGADPTLIKVSKTILESKRLAEIRQILGEVRREVSSRCTPSVMFRSGVYLLPISLLPEVDAYLEGKSGELGRLVALFLTEYAAAKTNAEQRLGTMFNASDYPALEDVAATFAIRWQYLAVDAPAKLGEVSRAILEREQQKAAATWADAMTEGTAVLRAAFADLIDHMVEKLQPGPDGKKRIFRDSMIGNVREFLRTFKDRNLGDDAVLADLAKQAERILGGVDAKLLRDGESVRERVASGMATIKTQLDAAICNAPARRYSSDDE